MFSFNDLPPELICFLAFCAGDLTFRDLLALATTNRYIHTVLFGSEWARARAYALLGARTCLEHRLWGAAAVAIPASDDTSDVLVAAGTGAGMTAEFFTTHLCPVDAGFSYHPACLLAIKHHNNGLLRALAEAFTPGDDERDALVETAAQFNNVEAYTLFRTETAALCFYTACSADAADVVRTILACPRFADHNPGPHIRRALHAAVFNGTVETFRVLVVHELGFSHQSTAEMLMFCVRFGLVDEFCTVLARHAAICNGACAAQTHPAWTVIFKDDKIEFFGAEYGRAVDAEGAVALLNEAGRWPCPRIREHVFGLYGGEPADLVTAAVREARADVFRRILHREGFAATYEHLLLATETHREEIVAAILDAGHVDPLANGGAAVLAALPQASVGRHRIADVFLDCPDLDVSRHDNAVLRAILKRGLCDYAGRVLTHPRFVRTVARAPEILLAAAACCLPELFRATLDWFVSIVDSVHAGHFEDVFRAARGTVLGLGIPNQHVLTSAVSTPQLWSLSGSTMADLVSSQPWFAGSLLAPVVRHANPADLVTIFKNSGPDRQVAIYTEAVRAGRAETVRALVDAGCVPAPSASHAIFQAISAAGMDDLALHFARHG